MHAFPCVGFIRRVSHCRSVLPAADWLVHSSSADIKMHVTPYHPQHRRRYAVNTFIRYVYSHPPLNPAPIGIKLLNDNKIPPRHGAQIRTVTEKRKRKSLVNRLRRLHPLGGRHAGRDQHGRPQHLDVTVVVPLGHHLLAGRARVYRLLEPAGDARHAGETDADEAADEAGDPGFGGTRLVISTYGRRGISNRYVHLHRRALPPRHR
jgi:hypothetical protein